MRRLLSENSVAHADHVPCAPTRAQLQAAPLSAGRTAAEAPAAAPSYARALYDFTGADRGELPFRKGDLIEVVEQSHPDWWRGRIDGGPLGLFPANHVVGTGDREPDCSRDRALDDLCGAPCVTIGVSHPATTPYRG